MSARAMLPPCDADVQPPKVSLSWGQRYHRMWFHQGDRHRCPVCEVILTKENRAY